jgi:two-component system, OmpR family, sensor kinase
MFADRLRDGLALLQRRRNRTASATGQDARALARDGFVREAAHTLRTPLAVAESHMRFVLGGLEPGTPAHADALVVLDELRRAARISDQLLLLGAAHRQALELAPVDLDALVRTVARRWSAASAREITVDAGAAGAMPADAERLRHALDALVENALNATGPHDRITIGAREAGDGAHLTVSDTGHGIAPDDLDRIFERFARGDASRRGRGTGLGLAIARAIARAHGGDVTVDSAPGHGTSFTLRLGSPPPPSSSRSRSRPRRDRADGAPRAA